MPLLYGICALIYQKNDACIYCQAGKSQRRSHMRSKPLTVRDKTQPTAFGDKGTMDH